MLKIYPVTLLSAFILLLFSTSITATGLETLSVHAWDKKSVRKVLHAFAYGGFASDRQIKTWSKMDPQVAIREILSFDPVNEKLSSPYEETGIGDPAMYDGSLESLQDIWSSERLDNPVQPPLRVTYGLTAVNGNGDVVLAENYLKNTWTQAINTRGVNPFLHKVGLYLTNYHMAISVGKTQSALMRDFYDNAIRSLSNGSSLFEILAEGATSAAVARAYGHQWNWYSNYRDKFNGNDDFAREFHQLFFKIQGHDEISPDYHENVSIEHTAWALTGMRLDRVPYAYGTTPTFMWYVAPIVFTDHEDGVLNGNGDIIRINNYSNHYHNNGGCLEILHSNICGTTAEEKIFQLAQIAGYHPESLDNLPVAIIDFFADDNLDEVKKNAIRETWRLTEPKSLLAFLQTYAVSTAFHNSDTVKYRSSFDRNLLIQNANTVDNFETFARSESPLAQMRKEGAEVFRPAHDVFGGQTGLQAANNPNIFKDAYERNVKTPEKLGRTSKNYVDQNGIIQVWEKDWASIIPMNGDGEYRVEKVASWLWKRFIGDGKKNYKEFEKNQIHALLAAGVDLGYQLNPDLPETIYSKDELDTDINKAILEGNKKALMALNSTDPVLRKEANERVGLAVNFITATPFMFALEGK